jgi:2'-5' RNA ligase
LKPPACGDFVINITYYIPENTHNIMNKSQNILKLISESQSFTNGLYCSAAVDIESLRPVYNIIKQFMSLENNLDNDDKFPHLTIVYSKTVLDNDPPKLFQLINEYNSPDAGDRYATIKGLSIFDNEDAKYLIILLEDDDNSLYVKLNSKIKSLGYEATFPDYTPHITVQEDVKYDLDEDSELFRNINSQISGMSVLLKDFTLMDLKD